jgi:hypothetical protein
MELLGFQQCIEFLSTKNLLERLKFLICDKDGKIAKYIRETPKLKHITILHDPGHWVKGVGKQLEDIFGLSKRFAAFSTRIKRWFLYCIKTAEQKVRNDHKITENRSFELLQARHEIAIEFQKRWCYTTVHYSRAVCADDCPCRKMDSNIFPSLDFSFQMIEIVDYPREIIKLIMEFVVEEFDIY